MQADSEESIGRTWRDLYLAALFEADSSKLPERIAVAEYAMSLRDRELWYSGSDHTHNKEKQALIGAMRALEALRTIHQCPRPVLPTSSHRVEAGKSAGTGEPNISPGEVVDHGQVIFQITDSYKRGEHATHASGAVEIQANGASNVF